MTRTLFLFFIALPTVLAAWAQPGSAQNLGSMGTGIFYGKIYDGTTQKGIEGATVQIVQNRYDSLTGKKRELILATQLSNKKGEFNIDHLPVTGNFKLKVTCIGYKPFDVKIAFDNDHKSADPHVSIKDLGNFKMFADATQLDNITVNANKPLLEMYLDKKVYNVEKDLNAAGGTATDVIKNIPGVLVDMDGNVTVRNAAPQIFVDGRPSSLTLEQIPSDQISSIELMTNPSAKYDAGVM
ncbi:MAG: hypothetical protein EOP53_07955 [Sphingobacteriales bacterium]|nr:MAG: hypothetical protein EOP53_07955 [Sphingobacteriales bacterium]